MKILLFLLVIISINLCTFMSGWIAVAAGVLAILLAFIAGAIAGIEQVRDWKRENGKYWQKFLADE